MNRPLTALALTCSLKPSPAPSSTDLLAGQVLEQLAALGVGGSSIRVVDHDVKPGVEADEDCFADQEVTDVELGDLRDGGDRHDIGKGQPVAGVGLDRVLGGEGRGIGKPLHLGLAAILRQVGVTAGVQLDHWRA